MPSPGDLRQTLRARNLAGDLAGGRPVANDYAERIATLERRLEGAYDSIQDQAGFISELMRRVEALEERLAASPSGVARPV